MKILALDTSSKYGSIAFSSNEIILAERTLTNQKTHSTKLLPTIVEMLSDCDSSINEVGAVAVAIGPGSFTGLRIALSTAKGICYGKKIPIIPISSLLSLANNTSCSAYHTGAVIDAGRNQIYAAIYMTNLNKLMKPRIIDVEDLGKKVREKTMLVGPVIYKFKKKLQEQNQDNKFIFAPSHQNFPRASSLIDIIYKKKININFDYKKIAEIQPFYLRRSSAEKTLSPSSDFMISNEQN